MDFEINMTNATLNGRFYSHKVLENAVAAYQVHIEKNVSTGTLGIPECTQAGWVTDLAKVSHMITKLSVENGILKGSFNFEGPQMMAAKELYQNKAIELIPTGYGQIENKKVINYVLYSISFTHNSAIQH